MKEMIHDVTLPLFENAFKQRVEQCWEYFVKEEWKLRELIDRKADRESIGELIGLLLEPAFEEVYAEVGFNGEKYELILNLEGDWSRLFSLSYFRRKAPEVVREHWNILVGRQSREKNFSECRIDMFGSSVLAKDIQVWLTWNEAGVEVSLYCEQFLPLLKERESEAYWMGYIMLDYAIGELAEMKYINEVKILEMPKKEASMSLEQLMSEFMERLSLTKEELWDNERYCQLYCSYRMNPDEEAEDGRRHDVFAGSGCFMPLLNQFWNGDSYIMDAFHKDGIVAGYFCYPIYDFQGENRGEQILDFRDDCANAIEEMAGSDAFTYIGGASGIYYGYIDFIAWDLKAVLDVAKKVFANTKIEWVMFHSFRQDVKGVTVYE